MLADGSSSQTGIITEYNPLLLRTADNEEPFKGGSKKPKEAPAPTPTPRAPGGSAPGPQVSIIGAHAFAAVGNHPEAQLFTMSFTPPKGPQGPRSDERKKLARRSSKEAGEGEEEESTPGGRGRKRRRGGSDSEDNEIGRPGLSGTLAPKSSGGKGTLSGDAGPLEIR